MRIILFCLGLLACNGSTEPTAQEEAGALKTDRGVDAGAQVLRIGALNDESGPAAAIGKPYAAGKRLLAARVNAGGSNLLPEGWTIELVERDHGYNPTQSVASFNEIKGEILFIGTSFGTPNTLPLVPMLEQEQIVAYPASLSSELAQHAYTPPLGPSYATEARRAVDFIAEKAGTTKPKIGIVYQKDDYGQDGLDGLRTGAAAHGFEIVSEQTIAPGQKDFTPVVTALKDAGADHVLLTTLPSATGPILGTAAQLQYAPMWIGNTPAWIDRFYSPEVIPPQVFASYHQVSGLPYWGEEVPGMKAFEDAWAQHGGELGEKDSYVLLSYLQGLVQLEAANRAIEAGDITRAGYFTAMKGIESYDAGGLIQPIDLSVFPYEVSTRTRILKPDFEKRSWTVVSGYAEPKAAGAVAGE